jgi:lysophospholipase L1-like esterase
MFLLKGAVAFAQPFIEEINAFKKQDSVQMPPKDANLFVGSSSLRMWSSMTKDFPRHKVINRGFGGSSLPDVIRYAGDIIYPYRAKQVIIYCGENDLAASDTVTAQMVLKRFTQLFNLIREKDKNVSIVFISIKPSPSRQHLFEKFVEANRLIKTFLEKQANTRYVDVFSLMISPDGKPRKELFLDDMLHMNEVGYAIWRAVLGPVLK